MKIRKGFVSNSSSSSFVVCFDGHYNEALEKCVTEDVAKMYFEDYKNDNEEFPYYLEFFNDLYKHESSKVNIIRFMKETCGFSYYEIQDISLGFVNIKYKGDAPEWDDEMLELFRRNIFEKNFLVGYDVTDLFFGGKDEIASRFREQF